MCMIFTLPTPRGSRLIEFKTLAAQPINALPFSVGTSSNGPHPPGTSPRKRGKVLVRRSPPAWRFFDAAREDERKQ